MNKLPIIIGVLTVIFLGGWYFTAHAPETDEFPNEPIIVEDFEGEADPNVMKLDMHTWKWIKSAWNNDTEFIPNRTGAFTLTFKDDGTFSARTDCNNMGGNYEVVDNQITFGNMYSTEMYCEGSQENEFSKELGEVQSFLFTSWGEMILEFKFDSGSMTFK